MPRISNLTDNRRSISRAPMHSSPAVELNEPRMNPISQTHSSFEEENNKRQCESKKTQKSGKSQNPISKAEKQKKKKIQMKLNQQNQLLDCILPQIHNHLNFMLKLTDRAQKLEQNRVKQINGASKKSKKSKKIEKKNEKKKEKKKKQESEEISDSDIADSSPSLNMEESSSQIGERFKNPKDLSMNDDSGHSISVDEDNDSFDQMNSIEEEEQFSEISEPIEKKKSKQTKKSLKVGKARK